MISRVEDEADSSRNNTGKTVRGIKPNPVTDGKPLYRSTMLRCAQ